jgi:HEAT repeat protein
MAANNPPTASPNPGALDAAFAALETYKPGSARGSLLPIDEAAAAAWSDPQARAALEQRFLALLGGPISVRAKEYVCGKLAAMGSAQSAAGLKGLLSDPALAHSARTALEAIACPEAAAALRDALPKLSGPAKVGVIRSLGARGGLDDVPALSALLSDAQTQVSAAAASSLGEIGGPAAADALASRQASAPASLQPVIGNARLACAEKFLQAGKTTEAMAIYKALSTPALPKAIQVAAKRGLLQALQRK